MRSPGPVFLLALAAAVPGQQSAALPSPGSQANTPAATLAVTVMAPLVAGGLPVLVPGSASTTYAWALGFITCGPGGFPPCVIGGGPLPYTGTVTGAPGQPLAILYSTRPAGPLPLPLGATLMGDLPTPFGRLHLLLTPAALASGGAGALLDGIGLGLNPAPPAATSAAGVLVLAAGAIPLGQGASSGAPDIAVQAIVADPGSASGFSLTAAMTTAQHQ